MRRLHATYIFVERGMRMTYQEIQRRVLEYLNQYSIAGETISPAYNGQSDMLQRIPGLLNAAFVEIYGAYPKRATIQLSGGQSHGGHTLLYSLPRNCKSICTGGIYRGPDIEPTNDYRLFGRSGIIVPDDGLIHWVEYWQKPEQIAINPSDDYELEEDIEVIEAACVYAASWLAMWDDAFDHTALKNLYEDKLERMRPPLTAEIRVVNGGELPVWDEGVW